MPRTGAQILLRDGPGDGEPEYGHLVRSVSLPGDLPLGVLLDAGTPNESVVLCPADAFRWRGTTDLVVLAAPDVSLPPEG